MSETTNGQVVPGFTEQFADMAKPGRWWSDEGLAEHDRQVAENATRELRAVFEAQEPAAPFDYAAYLDEACKVMHDAYEIVAIKAGWVTNPRSRVPWDDVPEANKETMRAAVEALLRWQEPSRTGGES